MKYKIDNIKNYAESKGWVCGQFFPEGSLERMSAFEAKLCYLRPGDSDREHYHPRGQEVTFVIDGKIRWRLDGKEHLVGKGDVIFMRNNVRDEIVEVLEPTTIVNVRAPSVADNKVYTETESK